MIACDTHSRFCNTPYQKVHTIETAALWRIWKKTLTAIGVSVSKVYVTFCGSAAN